VTATHSNRYQTFREEVFLHCSKTQKNKATEYHLGTLKAKLAKYRAQLLEPTGERSIENWGQKQVVLLLSSNNCQNFYL
jgi:ribosome-interacting GTPase 1